MKISFWFQLPVFSFCVLLISCDGQSPIPETEKDSAVTIVRDTVNASWQLVRNDSLTENSVVILEGFIGNPGNKIVQNGSYISMPIYERPLQQSGVNWEVQFKAGESPGQMKSLPDQFTEKDIRIKCENGENATIGSRVRLTAYDEKQNDKIIWKVSKIEFLQSDLNSFVSDTAQKLTSEIIFDSTRKEVYCYVEGKLELPILILPYTNAITLNLIDRSVAEIKEVEVPLGTGPSTMNDLPDNFREEDLIVRDRDGNPIPYKEKVRIYGNWVRFAISSSFPGKFNLEEIELIH